MKIKIHKNTKLTEIKHHVSSIRFSNKQEIYVQEIADSKEIITNITTVKRGRTMHNTNSITPKTKNTSNINTTKQYEYTRNNNTTNNNRKTHSNTNTNETEENRENEEENCSEEIDNTDEDVNENYEEEENQKKCEYEYEVISSNNSTNNSTNNKSKHNNNHHKYNLINIHNHNNSAENTYYNNNNNNTYNQNYYSDEIPNSKSRYFSVEGRKGSIEENDTSSYIKQFAQSLADESNNCSDYDDGEVNLTNNIEQILNDIFAYHLNNKRLNIQEYKNFIDNTLQNKHEYVIIMMQMLIMKLSEFIKVSGIVIIVNICIIYLIISILAIQRKYLFE